MPGSWRCGARRKEGQVHVGAPQKRARCQRAEASCTVDSGADALTLDNPEKASITDAMIGHWVEIGGRLESETDKDPDNLRELDVLTAKLVPVVIPRPAAQPAPEPAAPAARPTPTPAPAPTPMAPEPPPPAPKKLPKTASPVPAMGLVGLLSLAVGFTLRSFRLRHRA